jgi:hypothetical protein
MLSPESVDLAFGDVVQFGDADSASGDIRWYGPEVVARCTEPDSVEAFPVAHDEDGDAYLELPGTTWGTDIRIFGRLSLAEVRALLLPDTEPTHRPIFLRIHTKEDTAMAPAREYNFRVQD